MSRGRMVELVCSLPACARSFQRRASDAGRGRSTFCSNLCKDRALRSGRVRVEVLCSGCQAPFLKLESETRRCRTHYCSAPCFRLRGDHRAYGLAASKVPRWVDPEKRLARSRLGGLARTRNLTPERLMEISRMGVEARRRSPVARAKLSVALRCGSEMAFGVRLGRPARARPQRREHKVQGPQAASPVFSVSEVSRIPWVFGGLTFSFTELVRLAGVNRNALSFRLRRGWGVERAVTTPVQVRGRRG